MTNLIRENGKLLFWVTIGLIVLGTAAQVISASINLRPSEAVINEFVASNGTGLTDEDGDFSDWIEIHNPGRSGVNLSGWSLTDDPSQPEKWSFPNITLNRGEYLIVFASGKNRKSDDPGSSLHTNFKLNKTGDFLGLYNILDRQWVDTVSPSPNPDSAYPEQFRDISYGRYGDRSAFGYLAEPTPGESNNESTLWTGVVSAIDFNHDRGFFDAPFLLELTTATPGAIIRYTIDGSEPTETGGHLYTQPFTIDRTTPVRATAYKPGLLPSYSDTHTYIFLDEVLEQPTTPPGYPITWGTIPKSWRGYIEGEPMAADYEMDPEVVNDPRYAQTIKDDLKAIPSISIVMDIEHFTELYSNPRERGRAWERPVSVEIIDPAGHKPNVQINAGLRLHGGEVRWEFIPKHAFRLFFRSDYGPTAFEYPLYVDSPIEKFNTLVLRGGGGYAGRPGGDKRTETFINDQWLRDSQRKMSGVSAHGNFVHLYIDGLYWGMYNLVERPDGSFASSHLGGKEETWFAANHNGPISGPLSRLQEFQDFFAEHGHNLADPETYATFKEFIDVEQFIDYIILNWYVGNQDWPDTNWYAAIQAPDGKLRYFVWDGDNALVNEANLFIGSPSPDNLIATLFAALIQNADFKMEFADRLYLHLFNDGALTDANSQARWLKISKLIDRAVVGESARWGDTRSNPPATRDDWLQARDAILASLAGKADRFTALNRAAGHYPKVDPPQFSRQGGLVPVGFPLTMTVVEENSHGKPGAKILYTTDGSDPRLQVTGDVSPQAKVYAGPLILTTTTQIKARLLADSELTADAEPVWSALNDATFRVVEQDRQVRISEIMYNPLAGNEYEFIELQNIGNSDVDLSGAYFEGIGFTFPTSMAPLAPGEFILLARDAEAFAQRYPGVEIDGVYTGQLSNSGEEIALRSYDGKLLTSVTYSDDTGWPISPDGRGDSLVLHNPAGDPDDPKNWRASDQIYGSPGAIDPNP